MLLLFSSLVAVAAQSDIKTQPRFIEPLQNQTAAVGRDVAFSCVIKDLKEHQVSDG